MNKKEFLKIFGKTTFIEHLSKNQQRELYETVKELIPKAKVEEVIDKFIEMSSRHTNDLPQDKVRALLNVLKKELE